GELVGHRGPDRAERLVAESAQHEGASLVLLAPLQLVSLRHEVDVLERPACTAMRLGWAAAARGVDDTVEGDERGVDQGAHLRRSFQSGAAWPSASQPP